MDLKRGKKQPSLVRKRKRLVEIWYLFSFLCILGIEMGWFYTMGPSCHPHSIICRPPSFCFEVLCYYERRGNGWFLTLTIRFCPHGALRVASTSLKTKLDHDIADSITEAVVDSIQCIFPDDDVDVTKPVDLNMIEIMTMVRKMGQIRGLENCHIMAYNVMKRLKCRVGSFIVMITIIVPFRVILQIRLLMLSTSFG